MFVLGKHMLITLCIGLIGAFVFQLLHIPMPWLLGSITAVLIVQLSTNVQLRWHSSFRNIGLIIAGYSIGFAFTPEAVLDIKYYLGSIVVLNVIFILLFFGVSYLVSKRTDLDFATALTCCVPGGMTQVLAFAEEQGDMDMVVVTFFQVLRVLLIVGFVPLLLIDVGGSSTTNNAMVTWGTWGLFGLLIVCGFAGWLAQKLKIPTGYMLGPVFLLMGMNMVGMEVPKIPISLLHIAQLMIGIYIGLLLKKEDLHLSKRHIFYAFVSAGIFIGTAYGLSFLMKSLDFRTGFLSIVPGGLDQMGIIAASVHANVTIVTAFQLFRVLVVSIFLVPMVKIFVKKVKT